MLKHVQRGTLVRNTIGTCVTGVVVFCIFTFPTVVLAQSTLNPDISVIPRFLIETNDGEKLTEGVRQFSRPDFSFEELEIAFQSYLNPYAKADVILTLPGPDLENAKLGIEEVYATIVRGLPFDLNVRVGKYRVDFGKLNMMHPHAWPFVTQPLVQQRFLGEGGLNDLGISLSTLLPTGDVYSKLSFDLLRGSAIGEAAGIPDTPGSTPPFAFAGRLMGFFSLDDNNDLEAGISGYTGLHDPYNQDRFWYVNLDFKYKHRPSMYTSLVVQGELLLNTRTASQDRDFQQFVDANGVPVHTTITSAGFYLYANYQFYKIFSVGGRLDWAQSPYSTDDKAQAFALFFGYYPVEETIGTRLQYQQTTNDSPEQSQTVNSITLQILFSLGPHKAHPF